MRSMSGPDATRTVEFFFDPMCPYAHQTSIWLREVRRHVPLEVDWRFFSLEEVNRPEGKKHPWERPIAYGWTPMRVAAWLRRTDMDLCDRWYEAIGDALHVHGRRFHEQAVAEELLASIGAPDGTWDAALADPTTHDEVRADHEFAVREYGGFGVPIITIDGSKPMFGPVVVPAPMGDDALRLWDVVLGYVSIPGLYEIKTPKTEGDLRAIGECFTPYLTGRQWQTIQNPAP